VTAQRSTQLRLALILSVALAALAAGPAAAAPGVITEYPIPVLTSPYGITTGPDGKIWFVGSGGAGSASIGRVTTGGAIAGSEVVPLPSPELAYAATLGPDGNMWVQQDKQIDKVPVGVTLTSQITSYPLGSSNGGSGAIVPGPEGRLWFGWKTQLGAMATSGEVQGYETNSSVAVAGVTLGADGKFWYGEGDKIARMDNAGKTGLSEEFKLPSGDGSIEGLALGPDKNIWFTLGVPAAIGRITPAGGITIFPTPTLNSLPFGIAAGPDGRLWFAEETGNSIGSIPTSATSGADITEYSIGTKNVGAIYITAGPDSRMWFTEFNTNKLGAITTNVAPPPAVIPPPVTNTPLAPAPVAPLPSLPRIPSPAGCVPNKLMLTDVFPLGGKTQMLGVAPAAAVGKRVSIVSSWNGKTVAKATVLPDLSFRASAPLPPRALRFTNRAHYVARLGSAHDAGLKFARRMYATSITAAGRAISFAGLITPPLAKPLQTVTIRASASCSAIRAGTIVATVTPKSNGAYTATVQLPAALQNAPAVYLQAETRVRQNRASKKTFPSFTLIRGVKLRP
jgi:streptogramin lyase